MCRGGGIASRRRVVPVLALALVVAAVAACNVTSVRQRIGHLAVAGDEPQAVLNGRDVLVNGGNAVDAAVMMALTMVATLPSRVGLGGGGACLVYNPAKGQLRAYEFLPRAVPGGGGAAVPGLLRGLFAMQAEHGRARWESLIAPAENLARFGHPVSRALADDLAAAGGLPGAGPGAASPFAGPGGRPLREGDRLEQPDLATLLSEVRTGGVGGFYSGPAGRRYAEAATAAGLPLAVETLRGYQVRLEAPLVAEAGNDTLAFPPWPETGGPAQAAIRASLEAADYGDLTPPDQARRLLAALRRAPGGTGGAGFGAVVAATSADGASAVCGLTLNGLFGTGRLAPGTGSFIAAPPPAGSPVLGGLALLVNEPTKKLLFAGGAGDLVPALAGPLAGVLLAGQPLAEAIAAPRLAPDPAGPGVLAESRTGPAVMSALQQEGGPVRTVEALGRTAAISCAWDRLAETTDCTAAADPRGGGLGFSSETLLDNRVGIAGVTR